MSLLASRLATLLVGVSRPRLRMLVTLLTVASLHGSTLWWFHDRFWHPTDDGFYAHIAERVLNGEVLHQDVQDIHPAYIHAIHVAIFRTVGIDMLAMRYPLMAGSAVHVAVVVALLAPYGSLTAALGGLAAGALGVVQFFSPNANWYCLTIAASITLWMVRRPPGSPARLLVVGLLLGAMTGLRHLSGVWASMGVITVVLLELEEGARGRSTFVARTTALVMLAGLVGYLMLTSGAALGSLVTIVSTPFALLITMSVTSRAANARVVRALAALALGFAIALLPLATYYIGHGIAADAIGDLVARAGGETRLPLFDTLSWYLLFPLGGMVEVMQPHGAASMANGLYWVALPFTPLLNGILIVRHLRRYGFTGRLAPGIIAAFYGMVSILLEGPFYLYYSVGLSLVAVLFYLGAERDFTRRGSMLVAAFLAAVALGFHAGQRPDRAPIAILRGQRDLPTVHAPFVARASLQLPHTEVEEYRELLNAIRSIVPADGTMLVVPNDAQLYFLASRRNSSRFYNSALGLQTADDMLAMRRVFDSAPPHLVIYRPGDKYETPALKEVLTWIRERYELRTVMAGRQFYVRPDIAEAPSR